jgi:hypothetical protein
MTKDIELFQIYLTPVNEHQIELLVCVSPAGQAAPQIVELPFMDKGVNRLVTVLKILESKYFQSSNFKPEERDWLIQENLLSPESQTFHPHILHTIGQALYRSLFPPGSEIAERFKVSIGLTENNKTRLVLELKIDERFVHLNSYPWELLHDGQHFLALHRVYISRYIAFDSVPVNSPKVDKLNVLLISSKAFDKSKNLINLTDIESKTIHDALEKSRQRGLIELDEIENSTLKKLRNYLSNCSNEKLPQIIHFDGHGFYGRRCFSCQSMYYVSTHKCENSMCRAELPPAEGFLLFEHDSGRPEYVSAEELGRILIQFNLEGKLLLVLLSACDSGLIYNTDSIFNGIAQNLIGVRIPAVIGMQFSITVDDAKEFFEQFYWSIGESKSLVVAVSQGRIALSKDQWYRPVLYMRWHGNDEGNFFDPDAENQHRAISFKDIKKDIHQSRNASLNELYSGRVFIQYINPEIISLYGVNRRFTQHELYSHSIKLTKYAFLLSNDILIMPASYLFEINFINQFLKELKPLQDEGIIHFSSSTENLHDYAIAKKAEYREELKLFPKYTTGNNNIVSKRIPLMWIPRIQRSASKDITAVWHQELYKQTGLWRTIFDRRIKKHTLQISKLESEIDKIPERIEGKAFIFRYTKSLLPNDLNVQEETKINMLINRGYLESYLDEYNAVILTDTMLGQLDCGLSKFNETGHLRFVSLRSILKIFNFLKIKNFIDNELTWQELIELRNHPVLRWLMELIIIDIINDWNVLDNAIINSHFHVENTILNLDQSSLDFVINRLYCFYDAIYPNLKYSNSVNFRQ